MIVLQPCPYCGGKDCYIQDPKYEDPFTLIRYAPMAVVCPDCGAETLFGHYKKPFDKLTEKDVIKISQITAECWNQRR